MPRKKKPIASTAAHRELVASWERVKRANSQPLERGAKSLGTRSKAVIKKVSVSPQYDIPNERDVRQYPSRSDHRNVAARPQDKKYTGNKMLGVAVLHKSNGIPVFSNEEIIDVCKMRRG